MTKNIVSVSRVRSSSYSLFVQNPMTIFLSWNRRGLGNHRTVRDLHHLVKDKRPTFLFLIETKMQNVKLQYLINKLGFEGMFTMEPVGRRGGRGLHCCGGILRRWLF